MFHPENVKVENVDIVGTFPPCFSETKLWQTQHDFVKHFDFNGTAFSNGKLFHECFF